MLVIRWTPSRSTHTSPTSFYPMLSGTATVEQALAMTRCWLTNHSGYCIGNHSGSPPAPPPPPPASTEQQLSNWFSGKMNDNVICIRGGPHCSPTALDTTGMDAKHRSAAHGSGSGDCCPSSVYHKDGLAPRDYGTYKYIREEAYGSYLLPTDDELRDRTLVQLKMQARPTNPR